jgi:hypothetical protein
MNNSSRIIEMFDIQDATDEEVSAIKDTLTLACNEALTEAMNMILEGKFYGCPHSHLLIALQDLQNKFPCDDCPPITPKKRAMN